MIHIDKHIKLRNVVNEEEKDGPAEEEMEVEQNDLLTQQWTQKGSIIYTL